LRPGGVADEFDSLEMSMGTRQWRYLDLYVNSYADATMCINPAIARARGEGLVPDTIVVYSHRKNSIVMGRQNDPDVDLDLAFCEKHNIIVKRVPTPGTIFGHPGYIIAGFYLNKKLLPSDLGEIFSIMIRGLCGVFEEKWGVHARYRPLNDLEVMVHDTWKKVGPTSLSFFGESVCFRMGITIKPAPMDLLEGSMPPPPGKLSDKQAQTLSQRVGSLEDALGREVSITEVKDVYALLAKQLFGAAISYGIISDQEMRYDQELITRYDNDAWFYANTISSRFPEVPPGSILREHTEKIPNGPLIRARVLLDEAQILDCSLTGWYHGISPLDAMELIEASLKGKPAKEDQIVSCIHSVFERKQIRVGNAGPEALSRVVVRAVQGGRVVKM
jgi:lipoate-protein ligase A